MNKTVKLIVQLTLVVVILILVYFVYESIMKPVRFNKERSYREDIVKERLIDIRNAEIQYRNMYDVYTGSFDTLIDFVMYEKLPLIKLLADPEDTTFTKHIKDTIGFVTIQDTLFKGREGFDPTQLRYIPFSEGQEFKLAVDTMRRGGVLVNVIEVIAVREAYLKGLNEGMIEQMTKMSMHFGSMTDPSTDGNWE
jgi:hypothetical protein